MYNPEIKKEFILSTYEEQTAKNIASFFNTTEEAEHDLEKDVAYFTNQELASYFESVGAYNTDTVQTKLTYLRNYKLWFNDAIAHCPVRTSFQEIVGLIDFEKACSMNFFLSIEEVLGAVDRDLHTVGRIYCPMFILAWYGLNKQECFRLLKKDVMINQDGSVSVKVGRKQILIDHPRCAEVLREFLLTTSYVKNEKTNTVYYENNDVYFIRKFSTLQKIPDAAVPVKDSAFIPLHAGYDKTKDGKKIAFKSIQMSGDMHRLYEAEQQGKDIFAFILQENPGIDEGKARERMRIYNNYKKYR